MTSLVSHPYAYPVPFMKRGGAGPYTVSVQRNLLLTDGAPENPDNNQYLPTINSSTYPSIVVAGKKAPRFSLHTCIKPRNGAAGWSNADLFNSLLGVDTTNNTDRFAFAFLDDFETRVYDWCRCERIDLASHAEGGPCAVMMGFKSRWAEDFAGYGTTLLSGEVIEAAPAFTYTAQVPDAGQLTPAAAIEVTGLDGVKGFQLTFLRGQGARYYYNGDNHPADIASTMFSGVATFDQEPGAPTQIADTGSVIVKISTDMAIGTGRFKFTLALKRDNRFKPITTALGNVSTTFSIIDTSAGGNPAVVVAY